MAKQPQKPILDTSWMTPGNFCWLDLENVDPMFLPATIVSFDGKQTVTIALENGKQQSVRPQLLLERAEIQITPQYNGFEDMVNMETLNDAELLQNLILRFRVDEIFTYVGPTLLVMNPFKLIKGITEPTTRRRYVDNIVKQSRNSKDLPPHVYAIAAQAYKFLFENEKNQAIVISGESGAGKTENAKYAMKLLTSIASDDQNNDEPGIEDQILGCNPILEAFGNAKTVRNNNSSRFGKYVRIMVDENSKRIVGAEIINYLLEKSRINRQGKAERNFHIFYILLKGLTKEQLTQFHVNQPLESFNYLNSSATYTIPNVNDEEGFEEIVNCFKVLGMEKDYMNIVQTVFAVLLLGNLEFDASTLTDTAPASLKGNNLAKLFELEDAQFQEALTVKTRVINKQVIPSPLTIEECQFARDTLAKDLFDRLFNWLVSQLNQVLQPKSQTGSAVGLLDIYGFEVFDKNGFEQIMINYTNEKLHQLYIQYVYKEEEKIFIEEGLQQYCGQIEFSDNVAVIELIDKNPGGIFSLLDESCQVKSNDEQLLQKIRATHKTNPLLKNPKMPSEQAFIVVHTAKEVTYNTQGFREKNKDEMSQITQTNLAKSKNSLIQRLYAENTATKDKFISQKIKKEMAELMQELNSCDVHFIRCIKPNDSKKPQELWPEMTLKQIRYLGVLDSLKVRKESYAIRRNYQAFYKRYCNVTRNKLYPVLIKEQPPPDFRELVLAMFKEYFPQIDSKLVLFGKTKIFVKQQGIGMIDELYNKHLDEKNKKTAKLQKAFKVYKMNQSLKRLMRIGVRLRMLANNVRKRVRRKYELRCLCFIQIWWKFRVRRMRQLKYEASAGLMWAFIVRYQNMYESARKRAAVPVLQRFCRNLIKNKDRKKARDIKNCLKMIYERFWLEIQSKKVVKIQALCRGFLHRKRSKQLVNAIRLAGRQVKKDASVRKIQQNVRIFLARNYFRKAHRAAYYIQGYFRMRILSDLFQRMRMNAILIQRQFRKYRQKLADYQRAMDQYIKPWEQNIQQQKADAQSFWSLTNDAQYEECHPILELCLNLWRPRLQKIALFGVPIDIDVLSDLYQCYNPDYSYARTLLNIIVQQFRKDHPIQTYLVTEESTVCVTLGGSSMFEFGDGQLLFNTENSNQVEKVNFPDFIKVRNISAGDQFLLIGTNDGTLLQYGDSMRQIKYKPFVHSIPVQATASNYIVSDAKLYSWVGVKFHLPVQHRVRTVSAGNQFALALCEGGQLYSWGENLEGELGLGDTLYRTEPTLVNLEKVLQISCGLKHAAARTRNKVYTWGWGERGQLGHSEFKNELLPKWHNLSVLWVNCGRTTTSIITSERALMWCGTNSTLSYQPRFETMRLNLSLNNMIPIRVISSYSKVVEITYITFANTISFIESNTNKKLKILTNLTNLWSESADPCSVDPPFNQAVSNYLYEASMHKPCSWSKLQIQNHFRSFKEQLFIDDDRQWAMKKKELVEGIQRYQSSVTKQDKLRVIRQRYDELVDKYELTEEEEMFLSQIHQNPRLYQLLQNY